MPDFTPQPNQGPTSGLTPHIMILNNRAAEAIDFYKAAFGAEERVRMLADDGVRLMHAHLEINGSSLMLNDDFPEYKGPGATPEGPPAGTVLRLQVDDADALFDRAVKAGATVRMPGMTCSGATATVRSAIRSAMSGRSRHRSRGNPYPRARLSTCPMIWFNGDTPLVGASRRRDGSRPSLRMISSAARPRATRLLIVPTAQLQIDAASS